jgi:type I restriction-modification system DNA methylase subunit
MNLFFEPMRLEPEIIPYDRRFPGLLQDYLEQIKDAVRRKKHHDQRRSLFLSFLRKAFNVEPEEVVLEEKVKADEVRGRIDALYKYVIFEFKTDLKREHEDAERELKKYFSSRKNSEEYYGLVSDGLNFELYQLEKKELCKVAEFKLKADDPLASWRFLDNILFVGKRTTPGANDISAAFGAQSAVFNKCRTKLLELFESVKSSRHVEVKFNEWNSLLGKVYGEKLGNPDLFVRHTYLTMLSRLMVAKALVPVETLDKEHFLGIITGTFFSSHNLPNLAEPDFFSWALDTEIEHDFVGFLFMLEKYINRFKFDNVSEDILKEIYQELVDPASRHALGEYYTPDWIADVTLDAIDYKDGTVLDPACGSGTFFLAAIRRWRTQGVSGNKLVKKALDSLLGIDVHPLAVLMSKANILLSLTNELRSFKKEISLPIYMADTLLVSEEDATKTLIVRVSDSEAFHIPLRTLSRDIDLDELIDRMVSSCELTRRQGAKAKDAWDAFSGTSCGDFEEREKWFWHQNYLLMDKLLRDGRDTVWGYILKNAYRPAYIRHKKVDYVVGNPPWLAYRYIQDESYKKRVKELTFKCELLTSKEGKLFTHMDTSTLFFVYAERQFLKEEGTIAMVLPRSVMLPSQQHSHFQDRGVSEILDFGEVSPVFNVPCVTVIRRPRRHLRAGIPTQTYSGHLPLKNLTWAAAKGSLTRTKDKFTFLSTEVQSKYYYPRVLQGATIVPRCFWYVQRQPLSADHVTTPHLQTSADALKEAKKPWQIRIRGRVDKRYLYETVLSKALVPFAVTRPEPVFLPMKHTRSGTHLFNSRDLMALGDLDTASWLTECESLWVKNSQSSSRSLMERLNYNGLLTTQDPRAPYVVLFNTSGTNLTSALYERDRRRDRDLPVKGFVAGHKTYCFYPSSIDEGDYLCATLNSDVVNWAIKPYQPQGLFGERDICRRAFEVCAIPKFDPKNPIHTQLAKLGRECREEMDQYVDKLEGRVGKLRQEVRSILKTQITKINRLVRQLLAEEGQNLSQLAKKKKKTVNGDLFKDNGL